MTWPFENDTSAVTKKLAKRFLTAEKTTRRILSFTIAIATILILSTLLILVGFQEEHKDTQRSKAQITMAITQPKQLETLKFQPEVEWAGVYAGLGFSYQNDIVLNVLYEDEIQLSNQERLDFEGTFPIKEDEVLLQNSYIEYLQQDIQIGDMVDLDLTGVGTTEKYTVTGIVDSNSNGTDYFVWISEDKAQQIAVDGVIPRTAYIRLNTDSIDIPVLQSMGQTIAKNCGILEESVQIVNDYYAVMSGSDTGGTVTTILPITLTVLVLAGIVIYSIFFVSVTKNVRNFGQLRTVGLTKKQMKKVMRIESRSMMIKGISCGVIISGLIAFFSNMNGFRVSNFLQYGFIVAVCMIFMTLLAIQVPVRIASNISPLEGTRYTAYNANKSKKVKRQQRNWSKLSPKRLGKMNLHRSLKKTILTTIMLSLSGVIFVVVVMVANSLSAEKMARFYMFPNGDLQLKIQEIETSTFDSDGNSIDRVSELQRTNNPLNQDLIAQLGNISGVQTVVTENAVNLYIQYREDSLLSSIAGTGGLISTLTKEQCDKIADTLVSGSSDHNKLSENNGVLIRAGATGLNVGDVVELSGTNAQNEKFTREVPVIGIFDQGKQQQVLPLSSGSDFYVTDMTAKNLTGITDQTGILSISTEQENEQQVYEVIKKLSDENDKIDMYSLQDSVQTRQALFDMKIQPLFMIALILFLFSIISLTNTQLTNFLERKQELALLQSVGMTKKQQQEMIRAEEHFYLKIAIISTAALGSILGTVVCFYIERNSHCIQFQYPWLMVGVFLGTTILANYLVCHQAFRITVKDRLIDRLHTQE